MKQCKHPTCGETCRRPPNGLKRTKIKKVSDKRKAQNTQYSAKIKHFKALNKYCKAKLVNCQKVTMDVHHMAGRANDLLLEEKYWLPVCRNCHDWITENSAEAIDLGLSISRLKK